MAFFGTILRTRRGDFNFLLIAALVALFVLPGASGAAIAPQNAEAMFLWLHSESASVETLAPHAAGSALLSISHQKTESASETQAEIQLSTATAHCGQWSALQPQKTAISSPIALVAAPLERHAMALLSGVRTNRRLI